MRRNKNRVLTTHTGRLANPSVVDEVTRARAEGNQTRWDELVKAGIGEVVRKQVQLGNDVHSDGEFYKVRDQKYYDSRVTGVEYRPLKPGEGPSIVTINRERKGPEFQEFWSIYDKVGNTPRPGVVNPVQTQRSVIRGPLEYLGQDAIKHELEVASAGIKAARAKVSDFFYPILGPGWLGHFLWNEYYKTEEEWVYAMAEMLKGEFQAVLDAGFELQIDDPGLCDKFGLFDPALTVPQYRKHAALRIEATNYMLKGMPADNIRYHTCWGSWHTPHTLDIPFKHVIDLLLKVNVSIYSVEAADARHQLDWKVWLDHKLPAGKVYEPGVVAHKTSTVEPAELVADRIMTYAKLMGRENIIASTDCGYGNRTYPDIGWAKMRSVNAGAKLASKALWAKGGSKPAARGKATRSKR